MTAPHELVGRQAELSAVAEFVDLAADGPRALLLEGEAGIGKTSLWQAGLAAAGANGWRLLSSAPGEAEVGLPYAVLGDLLDPVAEEAVASLSGALRTAMEVALFRAPATQGPTDQLAVSTAFVRVLRHLAAKRPLLLAVDDIQWVDAPSMRVLAFAIHRLEGDRVRLLASLRVPALNDAGATLQKAVGHRQLTRLEVGPLPFNAIDDLLLHRLERPLRRPELERVYSVSGGNPYFALEIGRFLLEHPTTVRAGEPAPVPQSLAEAIVDRVHRLPRATFDILVAMAALARPDDALLRQADKRAGSALRSARKAQVMEEAEGRLRFTHPLLASVIYSMAEPAVRRRWHARLAELVGDSEERARHLALSTTTPDAAVADALETAARSANARGAPDAAATLAQQAAELTPALLPSASERRRIMTAEYWLRAGDAPAAHAILESVVRAPATGQRPAEALRLLASIMFAAGDLLEVERLLVDALAQAGDDLHAQAMIERDLVRVYNQQGRFHEAHDHSGRLTEIAARSGDRSLVALAQRLRAGTELHFHPLTPAMRATAIALVEGRDPMAIDDSVGGLHPVMEWAVLLKWSDEFAPARTGFRRALAMTEGRDESLRAPILFHLAELECWTGNWQLAASYVSRCERSALHTGQRAYARLSLTAAALLHYYRGELEAAESAASRALAIAIEIGDEPYRRRTLAILGATQLSAGDPASANEHFELLRARGSHPAFRGAVRSEGDEVEALVALGRVEDAEAVATRMARFDDHWQRAIGARCRALVAAARGDLTAAIRDFDQGLDADAGLGMPLERARTLLALGAVLRRAKKKRAAQERLAEALEIFTSLGATAWIRRADAELGRVAPEPRPANGRLSTRETEVAALVAKGFSNDEIATRLFISRRTAESHLEHILAKLALRNRSEVVAWVLAQPRETVA